MLTQLCEHAREAPGDMETDMGMEHRTSWRCAKAESGGDAFCTGSLQVDASVATISLEL